MTVTIGDLADIVRSKNAGPFWQTLDIMCSDPSNYRRIAGAGFLTPERIAEVYRTDPASVTIYRLEPILAIKISFPRRVAQAGPRDRDVHAGQQHIPIMILPVPDASEEEEEEEVRS